ncbi:carbon-monoxide dehydrogenase large subunit [Monaibacterium marinum]|uniref:Carbon-monoxide dehydrogenase large subunit n=1 Tax=Pontivivens marinum TaxID=1690039 RepID=A0A2C9CUB4_9RHOB|nr:xanthine dehydrogenase family protein molybdopterin-binding subunit [Monaibacterium marinum]SOH94956.1 carbon-monoxide dehydrogenase large subunit [Monaibacterium marinum]
MAQGSLIGQSLPRVEDDRLLDGAGCYIDDVALPGMMHMAILRSSDAHGRITALDCSAARLVPGVIDVFTAEDWPQDMPVIPMRLIPLESSVPFLQRPLAQGKVRYVGEPVAVVVARDRRTAEDALEFLELEIEALPPVVTRDQALAATGDALMVPEVGTNISAQYQIGRGDIEDAFARADVTLKKTFQSHRHTAVPLETRGTIAVFDIAAGKLTIHGASKVTFFNRAELAKAFNLRNDQVDLITSDIGGGFGVRGELYPEYYLAAEASRRTGRPVKWIEDRREHFAATNHSRDVDCELEIAALKDGTILGMRGQVRADMGAYIRTNGNVVPAKAGQFLPGPYRVPAFACEVLALVTNKTPVGTYRGPGRIEANFFRERMLDCLADELGMDPAALRMKNLLGAAEMPFDTGDLLPNAQKVVFDSGDYPATFRKLLDECDWDAPAQVHSDGRLHAMGLACFNESSGGGLYENARISVAASGQITVSTGSSSMGQGVETAIRQICADALSMAPERITVALSSTTLLSDGVGSFHSRSTVMAGSAVGQAAAELLDQARGEAGRRLNAAPAELDYSDGVFRVMGQSDRSIRLSDLSAMLSDQGGLDVESRYEQAPLGFSFGAHAAHVAIDPGTGDIEVLDYWVVEDVGRVLNPALVEGQTIGGVVQGLGDALYGELVYDDMGQLLTASFADYLLPTSTEVPDIRAVATGDYPSPHNPYGFKGAGEGGIVAVAAAVGNAIARAIGPAGDAICQTPFHPEKILTLLHAAKKGKQ